MAIYRNVHMSFWTDRKVLDEFNATEKYLYIYLLTNPQTNLSGCYEISMRQVAFETGLEQKKIKATLKSLTEKNVVSYCETTGEVLIIHWHRYNWTASEKFRKPLLEWINEVKHRPYKEYLMSLYNGEPIEWEKDMVSIGYDYPMDTTVSVSVTDTVSDTVSDKKKHQHGEFGHVLLTDDEYNKLMSEYPSDYEDAITYLDEYMEQSGKTYKSCYMALRRWGIEASRQRRPARKAKHDSELDAIL